MTEEKNNAVEWGPENAIRELLHICLHTQQEADSDFEQPLGMLEEIAGYMAYRQEWKSCDHNRFHKDVQDLYAMFRLFRREVDRLVTVCLDMMSNRQIMEELQRFMDRGPLEENWYREVARDIACICLIHIGQSSTAEALAKQDVKEPTDPKQYDEQLLRRVQISVKNMEIETHALHHGNKTPEEYLSEIRQRAVTLLLHIDGHAPLNDDNPMYDIDYRIKRGN